MEVSIGLFSGWIFFSFLTNRNQLIGDLHGGNSLFTAPMIPTLSEEQIRPRLGNPELGIVQRRDGAQLGPSMPRYLVRSATFRGSNRETRIVDLGRGEIKILTI